MKKPLHALLTSLGMQKSEDMFQVTLDKFAEEGLTEINLYPPLRDRRHRHHGKLTIEIMTTKGWLLTVYVPEEDVRILEPEPMTEAEENELVRSFCERQAAMKQEH